MDYSHIKAGKKASLGGTAAGIGSLVTILLAPKLGLETAAVIGGVAGGAVAYVTDFVMFWIKKQTGYGAE